MDEQSEKLENVIKDKIWRVMKQLKNTITEVKKTLERINSILNDTKWISNLEEQVVQIT